MPTETPGRTAADVLAIARAGGLALDDEAAARVARAIAPVTQTFAEVALPFETEPAHFVMVQRQAPRA